MLDVEKATVGENSDKPKIVPPRHALVLTDGLASPLRQKDQSHYSSKSALATSAYYCNDAEGVVLTHSHSSSLASSCFSRLLRVVFSTPGLVLLVVSYSVLGALIFPLLEAPLDIAKSTAIAKSREDCLRELWIITEKLNVLYERNWTMLVHEQLRRFEGSIVAATRNGGMGAISDLNEVGSGKVITRFGGNMEALEQTRWSFKEALLYSVTVITTIGHGSLTPKSAAGKIATILYALIGVPLMLMCLSSLGALLAEALQYTYARICCGLSQHDEARGRGAGKRQRRRFNGGVEDSSDERGKTIDCCIQSNAEDNGSGKYDLAMSDAGFNKEHEDRTNYDSHQVDQSAPAKVNYSSPCMQLKSTTIAANEQYYQRTTAASGEAAPSMPHQPHPDVMLMATPVAARKLSQQQQQLQQQQAQCSSRESTSSPQPMALHPLQTYHIFTSASANSSPTHRTPRQYGTLQPRSQQLHQQQHFVAVPSSIMRFQPVSHPASFSRGENRTPPNCYSPASVAITGAATIYFPLPTTAAADSSPSAATVKSTVAPTQLSCGQPLVKYNTIQLHHSRRQPAAPKSNDDMISSTTPVPLPPPPVYQTATVHGVRHAKFATKPLSPEINTLLAETNSVGCRYDLSQHASSINPATAAATPSSANAAKGSLSTLITAKACKNVCGATPALESNNTVDIMEDEEENEQQRLGKCPHGTPSRVPLIASTTNSETKSTSFSTGDKESERSARRIMNVTAASFHRHTLNSFYRGTGTRKLTGFRSSCNIHSSSGKSGTSIGGSDTAETSDDEEYIHHGSEDFVLEQTDAEDVDNDDLVATTIASNSGPQVPISIVALILLCYIGLGTVIFTFWENWSLVDGAYFCFVTLATIGFGDFLPERTFNGPEVQLFACCVYLLLGLILVAMSFSILESQLMWKCKRIAARLKLAND